MSNYDPKNWYWINESGKIYSSAKSAIIAEDDEDYQSFLSAARPTIWPRDEAGEQTEAALLSVISPPVESVSARQFKLQLLIDGLIDDVEAWISEQDRAIQIAYAHSGSFVKNSEVMQAGFTAMKFTPKKVDEFFNNASKL